MKGLGLVLGLGALVIGTGVYLAYRDSEDDGTTECFNPLVLDTWGKATGRAIIILNSDGSLYQLVGALPPTTQGFLVWKQGTQEFRYSADDDWNNATSGSPFPWNAANPLLAEKTQFLSWCNSSENQS